MSRVKDRLIFETKKMDAVSQRKSNKEQQLRSKETQSNKLAEKSKRKKDHFKAVDDWAQSAASNRGRQLDDNDKHLQNMGGGGDKKGPNRKRENADKKFGFGGKKGRFKQNDARSMNDMKSYNPKGNFAGGMKRTGASSGPSSGGPGAKRKGKRARDSSKSRA
jgi:rRNA-processing protein EBP2